MSNDKYKNKYRIASARARWHDYNNGEYFVTVCTHNREHYFGRIVNGVMQLSEIGQFAEDNLKDINNHYPYAEIPLFVVMPNHIHSIVIIDETNSRDVARRVSTNTIDKNKKMQDIANRQGLLSVCAGGYKSAVTRYANQHQIEFAWQSRFHDHIIKNDNEKNRIADYIKNNVANWHDDKFYTE